MSPFLGFVNKGLNSYPPSIIVYCFENRGGVIYYHIHWWVILFTSMRNWYPYHTAEQPETVPSENSLEKIQYIHSTRHYLRTSNMLISPVSFLYVTQHVDWILGIWKRLILVDLWILIGTFLTNNWTFDSLGSLLSFTSFCFFAVF